MDSVMVALIAGASLGAIYALVSLGLVLVFRATFTFNFAHGQFMLLPAVTLAAIMGSGKLPFSIGLIVALLVIAMIAAAFYVFFLRFTIGQPHWMGMIATFGLAAILDGGMSIVFGSSDRLISIPGMPSGAMTILGTSVSSTSLVITIFAFLLSAVVVGVMRWTHLGMLIRAAGQDPTLAAQGGIRVRQTYMGSWAVAGVLAGIAGILYASTSVVNTSLIGIALAAFPAILLGGIDSFEGAVAGGLTIGIIQGFIATYLGGEYLNVSTYGLLLVVLMLYPQGLFGTRAVRRL